MTSKGTSKAYSSSGRCGGTFPSHTTVALTSIAAAAAGTAAWSSDEHLDTSVFHASSFTSDRGSAKRLRAASLTPPAWRRANEGPFELVPFRSFLGGFMLPGVPSPGERHQPREQKQYVPALCQREPLSPLDPAVRLSGVELA